MRQVVISKTQMIGLVGGHMAQAVEHGARGDIRDADGRTAAEIMRRKKDPAFHRLADRLART